jgi:heme/copper-type cytochrome/quinol oxidase subunit 4
VALALALPHLLDPETTRALLTLFIDVPHTDSGLRIVLGARVLTLLVFALVLVGVLWLLEKGSENDEED